MALTELKEGLAFLRKLHPSSEEERTFITNSGQPQHHEGIRLDRFTMLPAYQKAIHPVLEKHVGKTDSPVIEVGCGSGSFSRDLAPDWLRNRLVSFDLNMHSLKTFAGNDSGAQIFRGSSYRMPVGDQTVSAVIGYSSFDSMLYLSIALEEAKRVLKPGGKLVLFQDLTADLYEPPRGDSRQSVEDYHEILIELAEKAGMIIEEGREKIHVENVESIASVKKRIPDFELEEMPFPIIMIWERGYVFPSRTRRSDKRNTRNTKEEIMNDLAQGSKRMQEDGYFDKLGAKGGDLVSFLTMRYLVLQKPQ